MWDGTGFLLLYKRLDKGRFRWPRSENEVMDLSEQQLRWLLEGLSIEQPNAIKISPGAVQFNIENRPKAL